MRGATPRRSGKSGPRSVNGTAAATRVISGILKGGLADGLPLRRDMAVEEMTPGVARLRTLIANIYLVGRPGGPWVLVDTGTPGNAERIRDAAELRFGRGTRPEAIRSEERRVGEER